MELNIANFYTETEAVIALSLPLDVVHRFYVAMIAQGHVPIHREADGSPRLSGHVLLTLRAAAAAVGTLASKSKR